MDRQQRGRRIQIRNRNGPQNKQRTNTRRRTRLISRRNRRFPQRRNRLERVQNIRNRIGGLRNNKRFIRFNNFNRRINFERRTIFVGGLPRNINNRLLLQLFRREGRIISYRVMRNSSGLSRGFGFIEFARPRDAWRSIQKWNRTSLENNIIKVQYIRRNYLNQRFRNNNFNNRNNGRFNQPGRGLGFRGGRRGLRRGYRQRGRY